MNGGQTTQDVKDNFGILVLPKKNASDEYTDVGDAAQNGGYAIPYGVKTPNEVLTVMDMLFSVTYTSNVDPVENYLQEHVDEFLNSATGTQSRKTVARLSKLYLNDNNGIPSPM